MATAKHVVRTLLTGVIFISLACSAYGINPPEKPPAAVSVDPAIELVKALAWPIAALSVAFVFRRPISLFLSAIGSRITKLSLFKVELELVAATATQSTALLDDIRTATTAAQMDDSSRLMLQQIQGTPADFAVIDLGHGDEWLTSRLYIAAVMIQRMRNVQAFVFVEHAQSIEQRFVAVASVSQLRWALAQRYPWLEAAWVHANLLAYAGQLPPAGQAASIPANWFPDPRTLPASDSGVFSDAGALEPGKARRIVISFIDSLQQTGPPDVEEEWVTLEAPTRERGTYVTRELLRSLLPQSAFLAWTDALRDSPRGQRTRAVLRRVADFVALTEGDREFIRLANRRALLEDIAASLGEEPEKS